MSLELGKFIAQSRTIQNVLNNTSVPYGMAITLKPLVKTTLEEIVAKSGIKAEVKTQDKIENLEAILLDLGRSSSGITENIEDSGVKGR